MARHAGPVLLDNNAIGTAVDMGVWNGLLGAYAGQLETVTEVEGEAGSYFRRKPNAAELMASLGKLTVNEVTRTEQAVVAAQCSGIDLHKGERDLWAHGIHRTDAWILCGPDKASVHAAVRLGLKERLVSLEQLLDDAGLSTKGLPFEYTRKWLDGTRSQFVVDEVLR